MCVGASISGTEAHCSRALRVVRNIQEQLTGSSKARDEHKANFSPYEVGKKRKKALTSTKQKCSSWSSKFVCLASKDALHVPSSVAEKEELVKGGLGEKRIEFANVDCSNEEFYEQLLSCFPKLSDAGGFELLRCVANSKLLEPISPSIAASPKLLRQVVVKSRVYIRPI